MIAALAEDRVAGGSRSQISVAKLLVALWINAIGMKLASHTANVRSEPQPLDPYLLDAISQSGVP